MSLRAHRGALALNTAAHSSGVRDDARDVTAELVRTFGGQADDATVGAALDGRMKGAVQ